MVLENIDIRTIDCAIQHIKTFHAQACKKKRADFTEPCTQCRYAQECNFDWTGHLDPLLDLSNVAIQLMEKEEKRDSKESQTTNGIGQESPKVTELNLFVSEQVFSGKMTINEARKMYGMPQMNDPGYNEYIRSEKFCNNGRKDY